MALTLAERTAPSTPASGYVVIYAKSDGRPYIKDDAGVETPATPTLSTLQATTSGTSIDFTGLPAGLRRVTVMLRGVSTNGTGNTLIQIGDATGGLKTSGYSSTLWNSTASTAFTTGIASDDFANAAAVREGVLVLTLMDSTNNVWAGSLQVLSTDSNRAMRSSNGSVALSGPLDRVRITTVAGTDTFDAGSINLLYE